MKLLITGEGIYKTMKSFADLPLELRYNGEAPSDAASRGILNPFAD